MNHLFAIRFVHPCCRLIGLQLLPTSFWCSQQSSVSESVISKDPVSRLAKWCLTPIVSNCLTPHLSDPICQKCGGALTDSSLTNSPRGRYARHFY